jgi:hypothetical protein
VVKVVLNLKEERVSLRKASIKTKITIMLVVASNLIINIEITTIAGVEIEIETMQMINRIIILREVKIINGEEPVQESLTRNHL